MEENKVNILNKVIEIEDYNGNTIMGIEIDSLGNIVKVLNCDIADIDNDYLFLTDKELLRIQREN